MDEAFRTAVQAAWRVIPEECRERAALEAELRNFEAEFGPIPPDFRWFLAECGGGPGGTEWIDDITRLTESHKRYKSERADGWWGLMEDVFLIGWDGAGNPYGIHRSSGRILVEDHTFGGLHEMAESFPAYLRVGLRLSGGQ